MSERKYTVKEIDELRNAVEMRWLHGTTDVSKMKGGWGRSYSEEEKVRSVEELVRTYMIAGHTAQDIYDADKGNG